VGTVGAELLASLQDGQTLSVVLTDYSGRDYKFGFNVNAISGLRSQIDPRAGDKQVPPGPTLPNC
jgi:hypothetical protein